MILTGSEKLSKWDQEWLDGRLNNEPILLVKVGSEGRPVSQQDIDDIEKQIEEMVTDVDFNRRKKPLVFVTHHSIDFEWVVPPN